MSQATEQLLEQATKLYQKGALAEAEQICRKAAAADQADFRPHHMLAALCHVQRRWDEALAFADEALKLQPASPDTLNLKGAAERAMGRSAGALASFATALKFAPDNAQIWLNLSSTQGDLGNFTDALQSVERSLALHPTAEAWNNRAAALRALKRPKDALESCEQALAIQPDYIPALRNKGALLSETFRVEEGLAVYAAQAELIKGGPEERKDLPHKKQHDTEQRAYLVGRKVREEFHIEEGLAIKGPAVNKLNGADAVKQWAKNRPQIVVVDDLLTPKALEGLRRFCRGSTVWRKAYDEGYLGAVPEFGFACPLLAQIADELREVFPAIFERHPLRYMWGFKHDSALSGIDVHADFAAVNVNFWITPDTANNDPKSGGLVLWDVAAPKEWDVVKYNRDAKASREFLEKAGAKPIVIPYRANRAVIFDSDLFHKTDKIDFKPGYLNRRINITMLYGDR